jgi:hypothetical protein
MSEADWWLCASCSSLNNLAARKCYSCGHRKPKDAVRASDYLGYRPVVSWDGKVRFEQLTAEELGRKPETPAASGAGSQLPPLREPQRRDTLAVAPRPPHPARITYRLVDPAPPPSSLPLGSAVPPPPGAPTPPGSPPAGIAAGPALVPVGPGPDPTAQPQGQLWPHWRELLDGPAPHADRLRRAASNDAAIGMRSTSGSRSDGMTLSSAIRVARTGDAREFIAWPEADRRPDEAGSSAEEHPAPSAEVRPPE